ncbi:uncharacterized protein AKAME5_002320100 [Lates japonicus]|uniref:Uncharacterized protein n=1 Tax=Lates japonicus TaxID=270547 RepID=A0AAD3NC94_LATJO|nr:uncharacterized protein AKAME5_002320100 [Lates japonicus]
MQRVFLLLEVEEERGSGRERVREGGGRTGSEAEGVALLLRLTFSRHPDNMKTPSVSLLLGVSVLLLSGLTVSAVSLNVIPNHLQFFKESVLTEISVLIEPRGLLV